MSEFPILLCTSAIFFFFCYVGYVEYYVQKISCIPSLHDEDLTVFDKFENCNIEFKEVEKGKLSDDENSDNLSDESDDGYDIV